MSKVRVKLVTPAAVKPVTLDEAKAHLRVDSTADDTLIAELIVMATAWAQEQCGRAIVTQTLRAYLDEFPDWTQERKAAIDLPMPPLQSVSSVSYTAADGTSQTLDPALYTVDEVSEPARILPAYGQTWPSTREVPNAVRIEYVAGYGDAAAVDPRVKQAIRLLVGHWYENREAAGEVTDELALGASALLRQVWHGKLW